MPDDFGDELKDWEVEEVKWIREVNNEIIIYQGEDRQMYIDVKFTEKTVWLSQLEITEKEIITDKHFKL